MIKLMMEVKRRPDLSHEEFRRYYEATHAPLAASLMPKCKRYVRNYALGEVAGPIGYDVIVEMWFDLDGPWQQALQALGEPHIQQTLAADEENFMDRGSIRVSVVEEAETAPGDLSGNGG